MSQHTGDETPNAPGQSPSDAGDGSDAPQPRRRSRRDRISALDEQVARLKAQRDRLQAQEDEKRRKRDQRCMFLIGEHLLKRARAKDEMARSAIERVIEQLPERMREAFEGWDS